MMFEPIPIITKIYVTEDRRTAMIIMFTGQQQLVSRELIITAGSMRLTDHTYLNDAVLNVYVTALMNHKLVCIYDRYKV